MAQNQQLGTFGQVVSVNTASNTVTITSQIAVGNVNINSTGIAINGGSVNNTNYPGTANNANNLGGVAASSYVNTAGSYTITGVHTYNANIVIGTAGISANGVFGSEGQSLLSNGAGVYWATAGATLNANNSDGTTYYIGLSSATSGSWTNAVIATSGLSYVPVTKSLTVGNNLYTTTVNATSVYSATVNASTFSVGSFWSANSTRVFIAPGVGLEANGSIGTAGQSLVSNGSSVYWTTAGATLNANNSDGTTYYIGLSSATSGSWTNAVVSTTGLSFVPSTGTLTVGNTVVATNFTGTANVAIYLGNSSATVANVSTWITSNADTAYTNAAAYIDTKIGTANSAITGNAATAYTNAVSYTDTKIGTANSAITGNAATAYSNAVSYTDSKIGTANSAITGNAATAYSNSTIFASNASNINTGTLAEARLPYRMDQNVRTTDSITVGNMTVSGNLYIGSNVNIIGSNVVSYVDAMIYLNANNTIANPDIGFAANYNDGTYQHTGFFRDASDGIWKVYDSYLPEPDANTYIDTSNTSFHVANFQANTLYAGNTSTNWFVANTSGVFVNSTLIGNSTGAYGKTEGNLNVNSAVFSTNSVNANNATYLNGQLGSYYAANSLLSNYQTTAGLASNVATLTANNTSFVGSVSAANVVSNAQLSSNLANYQTTAGLASNVATLTSNNATNAFGKTEGNLNVNSALTSNNSTNLGGVAAASYLTSATAASTYAPLASPTFTGTVSVAQANVLSQTLTDAATISWNTASGQVATVTLGASRTMGAPSNLKVGTYILHVIQGGSGSYTLTWNSVFKWPAGVAPVLSTAVGARDVMSFVSDGTNLYGSYLTDVK